VLEKAELPLNSAAVDRIAGALAPLKAARQGC